MLTVIKKGMRKKDIKQVIEKRPKKKSINLDLKKYCGVINLREDPLEYQKKLRNEWE